VINILCVHNICRADVNHDSFLDRPELTSWIMTKVQEHLEEASAENAKIFHHLDTDGDGKCFLWSSYYNNSVEINCICLF